MSNQVQDCASIGPCDSKEQQCLLLHSLGHYGANMSFNCAVFKMVDTHAVVERKKYILLKYMHFHNFIIKLMA